MQIRHMTASRREEWHAFVTQQPSFSLLQSWGWGEFKEKLGWKVFRTVVEKRGRIVAGTQMLIKPLPFGLGSVAYIPRGPLLDWQDNLVATTLLEAVHQIARQHEALFLRVEPPVLYTPETQLMLQQYGFQAVKDTNQPRSTLLLNLEADIETLFTNLPKKTRYHIRACQRKGVTYRQGDETDLPLFYQLMVATGKRGKFTVRPLAYYEHEFRTLARYNLAALFLADYRGETIAAEICFVFGQHGAAFHGASGDNHRTLPASDLLTWAGIRWAKQQGCQTYDLWGIPDEVGRLVTAGEPVPKDRQGDLWGVYYFKKGFGNKVVYYIGAYDYVYVNPAYAWLMKKIAYLRSTGALINFMDKLQQDGLLVKLRRNGSVGSRQVEQKHS